MPWRSYLFNCQHKIPIEQCPGTEETSMNPSDAQKAEQAATWIGKNMPALWYSMYRNLIEEGFTPEQAFILLRTYINTNCRPQK